PAGLVSRVLAEAMTYRDAMYYIMTGETFDGRNAARMGLVNESVPKAQLKKRTRALARTLLEKNPVVLNAAKLAFKFCRDMPWELSDEYLMAKQGQTLAADPEKGRQKGLKQFLDDKAIRPGLEGYKRGK
ncbi:MAG TPA: enoyl-CoA hydratase-related protein, partial [Bryobacteraceae bacterium]|nr:enoyl-CoA hydratase-related protein [Bryobacteraceae bacterium]